MGYDVSSAQLREAMGGNDWSGLVGERDAAVKGGTPLKQIATSLGSPCLAVVPVTPETLRHDPDKGPVAFVDCSNVTLLSSEGNALQLEGKRGGVAGAIRAILGDLSFGKAKKEVHEVLDRKGGDMALQDLTGTNAHGVATGLRMIMTELPRAFAVYDARGREGVAEDLSDGEASKLRLMRVMVFPYLGLVVTCGNLDGKGETVTIDTVPGVAEAAKRVAELVEGIDVAEANAAQREWDANTVRVGWFSMHFDVRAVLEVVGAVLLVAGILGYSLLKRWENAPAWLDGLLGSQTTTFVAVIAVVVIYAAISGMGRDRGGKQ